MLAGEYVFGRKEKENIDLFLKRSWGFGPWAIFSQIRKATKKEQEERAGLNFELSFIYLFI